MATGRDDDIIPDAARLSVNPEEAHHTGVCPFFVFVLDIYL